MKKNRVYIWLEDNCLGWHIRTRTGSQVFAAELVTAPAGQVFRNCQWEFGRCPTLKEFLSKVADASFSEGQLAARGRRGPKLFRRRMDVEKINVKPWQEESYRRIVGKLRPTEAALRDAHE